MKLQLNTRLFPQYNPLVSLAERKEKAAEAAKKEAEEKAVQELYDSLESINSFALGTTPNFTIDLNKDLLKLEDIDQLIVTFGQFGQVVQREILYFSDNYKLDYDLVQDDDGNLLDLEEYFTGRTITVDLLDHFYNDYRSFTLNCTVEDVTEWTIILLFEFSKEISSKIERGTYHIRLSADDQIFYSPLDSVLSCR